MRHHCTVRPAVADDVPELVRLRTLLFETRADAFFTPPAEGGDWRAALAAVLRDKLAADDARILVVDGADGLAACGIGSIEQWFPGPHLSNGRIGHLVNIVTDPAYRRRGMSRAIVAGLLDWFRERGVARVDLYASAEGEPLYRDLGFADYPDPSLYWRP